MSLPIGERAPDFTLPSSRGGDVTLSKLIGQKNVVLFFYPLDDSPGCTVEACAFRDAYEDFVAAGAEVIGISSGELYEHHHFARKHGLPMELLSDAGGRVRQLYGVKSTLGILPGRETFIIDRDGLVRHVFRSQLRVRKHIQEALEVLRTLDGRPAAPAPHGMLPPIIPSPRIG
jgi:peroxiredoxin Q/BCP